MTNSCSLGSYFTVLLSGTPLFLMLLYASLWERFIYDQYSDLRDRRAGQKAVILVQCSV